MDDWKEMLQAIFAAARGWQGEKVGYDTIDNYVISTLETYDQGWETAIRKMTGTWVIVARYPNKEEAQAGHDTWCSFLKLNQPTHAYSVQTEEIEVL